MVGQMQQELIKKNTVNDKMRMCTIDTKEPGLILEGTKDGKFRFEKESDKGVVEIDPEKLELCQDKQLHVLSNLLQSVWLEPYLINVLKFAVLIPFLRETNLTIKLFSSSPFHLSYFVNLFQYNNYLYRFCYIIKLHLMLIKEFTCESKISYLSVCISCVLN